ncbi:Zn-dependent exopeptidase [Clavulina sp. PMI_390]|nr:Zn-dependent exopeptidase [Clavulina sp. PMI_390]
MPRVVHWVDDEKSPFDISGHSKDNDDSHRHETLVKRGPIWRTAHRLIVVTLVAVAFWCCTVPPSIFDDFVRGIVNRNGGSTQGGQSTNAVCPQPEGLSPRTHAGLIDDLVSLYATEEFQNKTIKLLGDAVRIPTENFDDMKDVGSDPRWEIFSDFHSYLSSSFPLVHSTLILTKVNKYGLVYEWKGSNESLKPILLLGHQGEADTNALGLEYAMVNILYLLDPNLDVVPVNNEVLDQWTHPPYSGHFDGTYLWGRGSCDDKAMLISLLTTFETLLSKGFQPARTIFLGSGFDEETGGSRGANSLAKHLLEKYGPDYFALLLDEGGGHSLAFSQRFALPAVAEKGWQDIKIEISTEGGHSSIPPAHTSIGMLAAAIVHLENHPNKPRLDKLSPAYQSLVCEAEWDKGMPSKLRRLLRESVKLDMLEKKKGKKGGKKSEAVLAEILELMLENDPDRLVRSVLSTTTAVDLVRGGIKINALPERAEVQINHRVATYSSTAENAKRVASLLVPIAEKFHLALDAFGELQNLTYSSDSSLFNPSIRTHSEPPSSDVKVVGTMRLSDSDGKWLEPSPITPTDAAPFKILAGSIRQSWKAGGKQEEIFVAPGVMGGNTDTRYFWDLTKHIFRYSHLGEEDLYHGAHTVNEAVRITGVVEQVRFLTHFILNADESTEL